MGSMCLSPPSTSCSAGCCQIQPLQRHGSKPVALKKPWGACLPPTPQFTSQRHSLENLLLVLPSPGSPATSISRSPVSARVALSVTLQPPESPRLVSHGDLLPCALQQIQPPEHRPLHWCQPTGPAAIYPAGAHGRRRPQVLPPRDSPSPGE